jgi:hypothetical protein
MVTTKISRDKPYTIITASDAKYGDFLINHWLHSLQDNVNCKKIDIIVLDYGLSEVQVKVLISKGVHVLKCKRDGHVVNIRYRDIFNLLKKHHYQQILLCDGGDIIFQTDISNLFEKYKNDYGAVCERTSYAGDNMIEYALLHNSFPSSVAKDISFVLKNKKPINGGLILGPYEKIKKLCSNMNELILNKAIYGPDQVILNYTLYKEGFKELDSTYNYTIFNLKLLFYIKNGVFFENKKKIAIVHNSGGTDSVRIIKNFGYGPQYNRVKWLSYYAFKIFYKLVNVNFILKMLRKILKK